MRKFTPLTVACAVRLLASAAGGIPLEGQQAPEAAMSRPHFTSLSDVTGEAWAELGGMRMFFGHQSVGDNILEGVASLLSEHPEIPLRIVAARDASEMAPGVIGHMFIGVNGDPAGKIDHFASLLESGLGGTVDIAAMKFCYLDFVGTTDYRAAFDLYRNEIARLRQELPGLKLVHFTLPLTAPQVGPRAWAKWLLRRPRRGYQDNAVRAAYNALLVAEFGKTDPVFDLSRLESTLPDGRPFTVRLGGKRYPALAPAYTDDGGHLNVAARRMVAERFLLFLANQVDRGN